MHRQYENSHNIGGYYCHSFCRKDDFGKEKSVPTAGNVETSQKQTIVKKTIVETTVQEETTRAIDPTSL